MSSSDARHQDAHAAHEEHSDRHGHPSRGHSGHGQPGHSGHSDHGGHSGHGGGHGDHAAMFRSRFWLSLVLALPVMAFSPMFVGFFGLSVPEFPGAHWVAPVLGTVIYLYGGMPFLTGGISELRSRRPGMMLLIAMAITVAFVASWITSLGVGGFQLDFWWELALLVVIMLLGHWMEMRALGAASGALDALAELLPDDAEKVVDGGTVTVSVAELAAGDIVLVRSGGRVPADGRIVDGHAEFDESMITGESRTVPRAAGDTVVAGTVAVDDSVRIEVEATGDDTALAGIQRLVSEAQDSSSRAQALADRAAALLFWFALGAGIITFLVWLLIGFPDEAVVRTVTVLVIACPHALGLAIPLVIAISTERAASAGVLIKDRIALERMRSIDTVLFDKTGTLTRGAHTVAAVASVDGLDDGRVLALAAAAEARSEHPVARAITAAAAEYDDAAGLPLTGSDFSSAAGRGVRAQVDGTEVAVGGPNLLEEMSLESPSELADRIEEWTGRGASIVHVIADDRVIGAVALEDAVRPESQAAVKALRDRGVQVALITGDARQVAEAVGRELGIDEVFADVLPHDKDSAVADLQGRGRSVAMVGDGVNDAPALARADVGIAIGAGTDVAMESAGVVLAGNDPRAVLSMIDLSRASYRKMMQNLVWAAGYNVLAVPLAAGVLAPLGFVLSPAVGAILMSLSTIIVALNAQLLRRTELDPQNLAPTAEQDDASRRETAGAAERG
ncbi:heavy metal translocating P-type ATPase [Brevibacterium sp. NPDC049920]|uniref:Heavy metal translocating P-type ATPase n=1 Tax=Brevibacterium pityocampae TaxID=506594 RepID=A0ABP8J9T0_9MICO|nr:heavy metal translocating P-type ATPase [uncultured Brevibacterium sp.]